MKFFVDKQNVDVDNNVVFIDKDFNHAFKVLRLKVGDKITVSDEENDYKCEILEFDTENEKVVCKILEVNELTTESDIKVTIFQGLPKLDKLELIIQKCVELGVYEIIPIETKFCVSRINDKVDKKVERLNTISEAAAKQSKRGLVPNIAKPLKFKQSLELIKNYDLVFVAYEKEKETTLKTLLNNNKGVKSIAFFVGSEGGFDVDEIETLLGFGVKSITLGNRILRTETVGISVLSNIMYEFEM